jgi:hypothetical protein
MAASHPAPYAAIRDVAAKDVLWLHSADRLLAMAEDASHGGHWPFDLGDMVAANATEMWFRYRRL